MCRCRSRRSQVTHCATPTLTTPTASNRCCPASGSGGRVPTCVRRSAAPTPKSFRPTPIRASVSMSTTSTSRVPARFRRSSIWRGWRCRRGRRARCMGATASAATSLSSPRCLRTPSAQASTPVMRATTICASKVSSTRRWRPASRCASPACTNAPMVISRTLTQPATIMAGRTRTTRAARCASHRQRSTGRSRSCCVGRTRSTAAQGSAVLGTSCSARRLTRR